MSPESDSAKQWQEAAVQMASRIEKGIADGRTKEGSGEWKTFTETDLPHLDLLPWIGGQNSPVKFYWQDRQGQQESVGLGAAEVIRKVSSHAPDFGDLFYFGGCRFDPSYPHNGRSDSWESFGDGLYVLPKILLQRNGNRFSLSCHVDRNGVPSDTIVNITAELQQMNFRGATAQSPKSAPYHRTDRPDKSGWTENVNSALKLFEGGKAQKIVLARETRFEFEHDLNPWMILERLRSDAEGCYLFGFQPVEGTAFIGATPERLYRREQDRIETEALAGTRPRGRDKSTDAEFTQDLMNSDKDRREHSLVVENILGIVHDLCHEVTTEKQPSIRKFSRVQHLASKVSGVLSPDHTDHDLLVGLHPTPAVGGLPREAAMEAIRQLEGFDRGWYAGPVGRLGTAKTELAVGIRSGLVQGRTLTLYSGAGIVPGSNADQEWDEIEQKMSGFLEAVVGEQE